MDIEPVTYNVIEVNNVINNINNISISHHDKTKVQNFPITLNISYYNYHTYVKGWVIIKKHNNGHNCHTQVKARVIIKPKDKNTVVIDITY
jgi:hypothetical protein